MLKKRLIPCLDIKDGRTVKGVRFVELRDAGDPVELAARYEAEGADELVFLDITATVEGRKTFAQLVEEIARVIRIPFTVGGGISTEQDVETLLKAGADKISINSSAVRNPELIGRLAECFGSQCVVVAIDAGPDPHTGSDLLAGSDKLRADSRDGSSWKVYLDGGRTPTERRPLEWALEAQNRGAGEILLTSMKHDGTRQGFATDLTREFTQVLTIPVIASGGGGSTAHFVDIFQNGHADAALAASIFHFGEVRITDLKMQLHEAGIPVRIQN